MVATLAGACSSPAGPAPPPPSEAPVINCSASVSVDDVTSTLMAVSYPAPSIAGGAPPVEVACSPASGTEFPLGDTRVTCTASDVRNRQATCSFVVTLRHRELAITRLLAFGDSLTEGENGRPVNFVPFFVDLPNAYPTILQEFFRARIPGQQITVINAGRGGERVTDNDERLKSSIAAHQPQVLLLLHGANDVIAEVPASAIASAVRDFIDTARERGVQYVFVSTLPPVAPGNCLPQPAVIRCRGNDDSQELLLETNQRLRTVVPANGAHLVDPYAEFDANRSTYIDLDGLHLRPEGNRALASRFLDRIIEVIPARQLTGMATEWRH